MDKDNNQTKSEATQSHIVTQDIFKQPVKTTSETRGEDPIQVERRYDTYTKNDDWFIGFASTATPIFINE